MAFLANNLFIPFGDKNIDSKAFFIFIISSFVAIKGNEIINLIFLFEPKKDSIENFLAQYVETYKRDTICIYQYLLSTSDDLDKDKKDIKLTRQISTRLQSLGWQKQNKRERFKLTDGVLTQKTSIFKRIAP